MLKIGDLVSEFIGGPVMRIIGFLDACRIAVCRALRGGLIKFIAVGSLVIASATSITRVEHQHSDDEPPPRGVAQQYHVGPAVTSAASGGKIFSEEMIGGAVVGGNSTSTAIFNEAMIGGALVGGETSSAVIFTNNGHYLMRG